jgi:hypothetical protein
VPIWTETACRFTPKPPAGLNRNRLSETPKFAVNNDPTLPNAPYWNRWRWIADQAAARGLHLLLIYGEPGRGDAAWTCSSGSTCYEYGRRVGDLFKDKSNVIFCDGSDSHASTNTVLWRAMAEGVADGVNGVNSYDGQADYSTTMMTYHGYDVTSTFHNDGWLDFYGTEVWGSIANLYDEVNSTYNMTNPTKPSAILEANYEGYSYPDYYTTTYLVRVQVWQVFFAGGMGYAYGNNSNYAPPASTPLDYIYSEGAQGMQVFATFMRARAWWKLVPDQSIVSNPGSGVSRKVAVRSTDGNECLIYYPAVESVTINMGCITAKLGRRDLVRSAQRQHPRHRLLRPHRRADSHAAERMGGCRAAPHRELSAHAVALQTSLERDGWGGDWYRRGFFDDGTPFGSSANDECRIIVLDVADARADRPANHVLGRIRRQQRLELRHIGWLFAEPCGPCIGLQHYGHPVVELSA